MFLILCDEMSDFRPTALESLWYSFHVSSCLPPPPPPTFPSLISSCSCVVQTTHQCMVGEHWEKHKTMEWFGWMSGICEEGALFWACFYGLTALWLHSPPYPTSECSINQSAVLKEETSFSVKCEEEGEVLKSCWKKTNPLFSYCRCHLHLSAVVKASRLGPWVFCFHIPLLKREPSLMMRVRKLVFCPPSALNIFEQGVEQASFCHHCYSSHDVIEVLFLFLNFLKI